MCINKTKGKNMPTKTTKKTAVKKAVVKPAAVVEHKCECGENCKCHCHGRAHLVKHIIILAIVFALGMVCGKMIGCDKHHKPAQQRSHPVFVNGCLDVQSVTNKKLQEKLKTADADKNDCISVEEYRNARKELRPASARNARPVKGLQGLKIPKGAK